MLAITNRHLYGCSEAVTDETQMKKYIHVIHKILATGPTALILREKDLNQTEYTYLITGLFASLDSCDIPLLLHTYPETALQMQLKFPNLKIGLHLPLPLLRKHSATGEFLSKIAGLHSLGCSVHSVEEAKDAQCLGATYLLAGNIYETDCKAGLPGRGLSFLHSVCSEVSIPVYALGGITNANVKECMKAGAKDGAQMSGYLSLLSSDS